MCGILGLINIDAPGDILDLIRHRGPDSAGETNLRVGVHDVFLGHRRLSIVDLSPAGHQPMRTPDGSAVIVYNGEVYNHAELRRRLGEVRFFGHSDTETVLHFLAKAGPAGIAELNGIFAFALVDTRAAKLRLVRDPFGVKPLYYCRQGNSLAFCSELKPIVRVMRQTVSTQNLAELLRLRYSPSPDTLFKDIRKLRPGHYLEIDLSESELRLTETPYLRVPSTENLKLSFAEAQDRYATLLGEAVERQLMSDVEVGVLLSGGVDSALVAQLAQVRTVRRMKAFTVGFSEADASDEIAEAEETARIIGLEHHAVRIGFNDFLDRFAECVSTIEEPLATTSIIPMHFLAELAARHVKVVLSGQGADEPLGGYRRYQGELVRRFLPATAAGLLNALARHMGVRSDSILRALPALTERDDVRRFCKVYEVFSNEQIRDLTGVEDTQSAQRVEYFYDLLECAALPDGAARMMSLDLRMNLADDLLLYSDKITMRHSLECRVPLLDIQLVRFIESLPTRYRVRLGEGKVIHKRVAERALPANIVRRKKKGFMAPTQRWFRENNVVRELLLDQSSRFSSYLDRRAVAEVLDQHSRGFNRERHIFLLLGLHYWMQEFAA